MGTSFPICSSHSAESVTTRVSPSTAVEKRRCVTLPVSPKIRFEHVFSLRLRVGAGTWCCFQFVGHQRFRLPCDGQGKKAKKRPLCLILYFITINIANATPFCTNFQPILAPNQGMAALFFSGVNLLFIRERHADGEVVPCPCPDFALAR